eukprot:7380975-Prymnesium_polylepis.1
MASEISPARLAISAKPNVHLPPQGPRKGRWLCGRAAACPIDTRARGWLVGLRVLLRVGEGARARACGGGEERRWRRMAAAGVHS